MSDILARILARKREEIAAAAVHEPLELLERRALAADPPRGFRHALAARIGAGRAADDDARTVAEDPAAVDGGRLLLGRLVHDPAGNGILLVARPAAAT